MKWIWCDSSIGKNKYVDFCREFIIDKVCPDAEMLICTEGEYAIFLNGDFVDCGQFDDVGNVRTYDCINISSFLKAGKNTLLINAYHQGESSYQYSVGEPGLCYEITNTGFKISSDSQTLCAPSDVFISGESVHKTTSQYGYGFVCDARGRGGQIFVPSSEKELPPLQERPVKKCVFYPCEAKLKSQGALHRPEEKSNPGETMQADFLSFKKESEIFDSTGKNVLYDDNFYALYDLGEEKSGYLFLDIDADENTVIDIGYGEHLDDMRVRTSVGERCFANRYICRNGKQNFTYYIRRIAGRYIQLHIIGRVHSIERVGIINSIYPTKDILPYTGTDSLYKKILNVSKYTLKMCMHEHYEDCPWREQALYGSDSRNQMLFGYYAFGEYEFARASLELIAKSVGTDGFITIACPSDSPKRIPSFTFTWLLAIKEYIDYSKDLTLSQKHVETLKMIAEKRLSEICDGIAVCPQGELYWNFYEWSHTNDGFSIPADEGNVIDGLYNIFFYMGMNSLSDIFARLGEKEFAARIKHSLLQIKQKVNKMFWNEETGAYASFVRQGKKDAYSELTQAMALYSGIADEHYDALASKLASPNELIELTLSYLVYKYDALLTLGDKYKSYVYDEVISKWGRMLCLGATTFWETELGADDFDNAGSLCHGWSATPVYLYGKYFGDI